MIYSFINFHMIPNNDVKIIKYLEMAVALWRLVFSQNEPPILSRWLNFLQSTEGPMVRSIQEDAWNMFLHLCETVGPDLSTYTEDDAWPSLFGELRNQIKRHLMICFKLNTISCFNFIVNVTYFF